MDKLILYKESREGTSNKGVDNIQIKFTTRDRWSESPHFDINGKRYFLLEVHSGTDQWGNGKYEWELWCRQLQNEKLQFADVCEVCNWFCGSNYNAGSILGVNKHEDEAFYLLRSRIVWKYSFGRNTDYKPDLDCVLSKGNEMYVWRYAENSLTRFYEPQKVLAARSYKEAVEMAVKYIEETEGEQTLF